MKNNPKYILEFENEFYFNDYKEQLAINGMVEIYNYLISKDFKTCDEFMFSFAKILDKRKKDLKMRKK